MSSNPIAIAKKRSVSSRLLSEFGLAWFICREKYMDEMKEVVKNIKNHFRINDWVQLANGGNGGEKS